MTWLLDTNTVSFYLRGIPTVVQRVQGEKPADLAVSAITAFELRYGAMKRQSAKLTAAVEGFLTFVTTLPFDGEVAARAGALKVALEKKGQPSGLPDLLIAAHALTLDLTLVSNNTKDFAHIPGLRLVDWA
ncbi:MAG: type II toxin-antitoxin system VapC family toxin [Planctomycetes bacterium]|nr:type II toxin-antitoxin system VapC family toxin [Planctomycetota bacterium]